MRDDLQFGWEMAAIGTAISDPDTVEEATDLMPSDFSGSNQIIWAHMMSLHRRGSLEPRALIESLRSSGELDDLSAPDLEVRGEGYIAELLSHRGDAMPEYVEQVLGASVKRELRKIAALIAADAQDRGVTADEATDNAERRLLSIRRNRIQSLGVSMADLMGIYANRLEGLRNGTIKPAWTPKIRAVRDVIDFAEDEDYIIIAARPGQGKSSMLRYEFIEAAEDNRPVLLFNLENSEIEYARYAIAMLTGINSRYLKDPSRLSEAQLDDIHEAAEHLSKLPLYVKSLGAPAVEEIERISRQHISKHQIEMIGIDYLQLCDNGKENKVQDVSHTSTHVRGMAQTFGIPVLAAAQMSRGIEHRGQDAEPELKDLRESGSLEQDATIVMFPRYIWNSPSDEQLRMFPENVDPATRQLYNVPVALPMRVHIKKNRNGPSGTTKPILWNRALNKFRTLTPEGSWRQ